LVSAELCFVVEGVYWGQQYFHAESYPVAARQFKIRRITAPLSRHGEINA